MLLRRFYALLCSLFCQIKWRRDCVICRRKLCAKTIDTLSNKHIVVLAPHSDDEWIGCSQLLQSKSNRIMVVNCDMSGGDGDELHALRYKEMLNAADAIGYDLCAASDDLELFLRDVLTNNEVDVVMLPCYYDWHEEHFRVMYSFARAAKKVEYKGDVGMYQVSLPIPARLINHGFKMNRQQLKEKWNCLRELYPSQNYLPTQRFILNEHINGKLAKAYALEAYAVQSFERWNNSLERNSLSDNEKAFLRKNLQRIAVVREFASNRYLQN